MPIKKLNMKKTLLILCTLFVSFSGFSQKEAPLSYKIVQNDAEAGFVRANIDPFNILLSRSRMTFASQLGVRFYKKGIYINVSGDFHYADGLAETQLMDVRGSSVYSPQTSRNINAMVGYYYSWTKNGPVTFHLKSTSGGYNTVIHHVTKVDVDYKVFFGGEIGFKSGYSSIAYNYEDKKNSDPLMVKDVYSNKDVGLSGNFTTYMQYTWLQAGFCYGKIYNASADFSGYGIRKVQYMDRYYLNIVLPMSSNFEDIYYLSELGTSNPLYNRYSLKDVKATSLGFKLGYEYIPLKRVIGFGGEVGIMPGFKGMGNFYFATKVSFNLGGIF